MKLEVIKQYNKLDRKLRLSSDDVVVAEADIPNSLADSLAETPWGDFLECFAHSLGHVRFEEVARVEVACLELNLAWTKTQPDNIYTRQLAKRWNDRLHTLRQAEISSLMSHGEVKVGEIG